MSDLPHAFDEVRETRPDETVRCNVTEAYCPMRATHVFEDHPEYGLCSFHYMALSFQRGLHRMYRDLVERGEV